jgi:hypothetical protein
VKESQFISRKRVDTLSVIGAQPVKLRLDDARRGAVAVNSGLLGGSFRESSLIFTHNNEYELRSFRPRLSNHLGFGSIIGGVRRDIPMIPAGKP